MTSPDPAPPDLQDPTFQTQVQRLYRLTMYERWGLVGGLWVSIGLLSLWGLRYPIDLLHDYFTWAAVRYGLIYHPVPAFGLLLCVGLTLTSLLWQTRVLIWGLPKRDRSRLEQQVCQIRQQGDSHPLWQWVIQPLKPPTSL
jgi:hypothetical protein